LDNNGQSGEVQFVPNTVTKDMSIAAIVQRHPSSVQVFLQHGLFCFGCAAARFENLEQGAMVHGIDPDTLVADINAMLAEESAEPAGASQDGDAG
jgi:hybrid cluster-associated redox disulfide protein